jgi:phytoene/squalene synthetase
MTANLLAAVTQRVEQAAAVALARLEHEPARAALAPAQLQSIFNQLLSDELGSNARGGG